MAEKKHSAMALLDILIQYSDEDHILSTRQLLDHLKNTYDLDLERRTLYSNIDILEQAGYVISRYEDNGKGYYLEEKQFDKSEVLLLCNAIHSSHFISDKQSTRLINKLLKTLSRYEASEFRGNVYMPNNQKTPSQELMYNISLVSEAIRDNKLIQFSYMRYNLDKKMEARREEPYIVEPRYIVYADTRPYLIATNRKYYDFVHYRLDRISRAVILDEKAKELPKDKDAYEYARNRLFMFAGETETVMFRCEGSIIDQMIDIFGTDVSIIRQDDGYFALRVATSKTGARYLAQQFMDKIEILEPEDLRQEFKKELEDTLRKYKK